MSHIEDRRCVVITNGPANIKIWLDKKDRIDYEEIWFICKEIYIDLPGDSDLIRIE